LGAHPREVFALVLWQAGLLALLGLVGGWLLGHGAVQAAAYLEARIEEGFDLDACAAPLNLSRRQIERLFATHLGVTPVRYMNDLRLARGRALLAETDMKVTDVAVASGFASASHFSKSFRKKHGVSPYRFSHFGGAA